MLLTVNARQSIVQKIFFCFLMVPESEDGVVFMVKIVCGGAIHVDEIEVKVESFVMN